MTNNKTLKIENYKKNIDELHNFLDIPNNKSKSTINTKIKELKDQISKNENNSELSNFLDDAKKLLLKNLQKKKPHFKKPKEIINRRINEKINDISVYLNMNTYYRHIQEYISINDNINNYSTDSCISYFILPTTINNVTEINLVDININSEFITIGSLGIENRTFTCGGITYYIPRETTFDSVTSISSDFTLSLKPDYHDPSGSLSDFFELSHNHIKTNQKITFPSNNNDFSLKNILGFTKPKYVSNIIDINSSANSLPLKRINNLYFSVEDYIQGSSHRNHLLTTGNQFTRYKILARLSYNKKTNSYTISNSSITKKYNNTRYYDGPIDIQKMKIHIIDDYNNLVFMNNNNFIFTIRFKSKQNMKSKDQHKLYNYKSESESNTENESENENNNESDNENNTENESENENNTENESENQTDNESHNASEIGQTTDEDH